MADKIEKLEVLDFPDTNNTMEMGYRIEHIKVTEANLLVLAEKINEIIDHINKEEK